MPKKKKRHWIVTELFAMAKEANLFRPGWKPFSEAITKKTGIVIPPGTLKYWAGGHSLPRIDEVDLMAEDEPWPKCTRVGCEDEVNPKRVALGFTTCLRHGEPKKQLVVDVPYDGCALQVLTEEELKNVGNRDVFG